jgi:phenylacetic acid degradation operon negative regulatory protein
MQPQTLMLMLFGTYALDEGASIGAGSIIEVLGRAGVSAHATRSTLSRMVTRALLRRRPAGRKMYFGLTDRSTAILRDGRARIWQEGAVNDHWDGTWTLLSFSLPESMQRERHDLRSRLAWSGFGPVQGGLWIAPGDVPAQQIVADLGLAAHARVFRQARADAATDVGALIADAYDLGELSARYEEFLSRWDNSDMPGDALTARLTLIGEWLDAIRRDPRLPVEHLPADWPAGRAQKVFRDLEATLRDPAQAIADGLLDKLSS